MARAVEDMLGQDVAAGVWDPLDFGKDEQTLFRLRCVELKHGSLPPTTTTHASLVIAVRT